MPVMDGYQATHTIKDDEKLKHIPVVILTASALREQEEEMKSARAEGFLKKPVKKSELIIELMRFLPHEEGEITSYLEDKSEQESISPESIAKIPELIDVMENQWLEKWNHLSDVFVINEVEAFANDIIELGSQFSIPQVTAWGNKLLVEIQNYDMENAPVTLAGLPGIIDQLKTLSGQSNGEENNEE